MLTFYFTYSGVPDIIVQVMFRFRYFLCIAGKIKPFPLWHERRAYSIRVRCAGKMELDVESSVVFETKKIACTKLFLLWFYSDGFFSQIPFCSMRSLCEETCWKSNWKLCIDGKLRKNINLNEECTLLYMQFVNCIQYISFSLVHAKKYTQIHMHMAINLYICIPFQSEPRERVFFVLCVRNLRRNNAVQVQHTHTHTHTNANEIGMNEKCEEDSG